MRFSEHVVKSLVKTLHYKRAFLADDKIIAVTNQVNLFFV